MLRNLMRRWIGVQPQAYQCPNKACNSTDVLALKPIFRPTPGIPWKHQPVGSVVQCTKCGEVYCVTLEGVYTPVLAQIPKSEPRSPYPDLDSLISDVRRRGSE